MTPSPPAIRQVPVSGDFATDEACHEADAGHHVREVAAPHAGTQACRTSAQTGGAARPAGKGVEGGGAAGGRWMAHRSIAISNVAKTSNIDHF